MKKRKKKRLKAIAIASLDDAIARHTYTAVSLPELYPHVTSKSIN